MRLLIRYFPESRSASIEIGSGRDIEETIRFVPAGTAIDVDANGEPVSIELKDVDEPVIQICRER